MTIEQLIENWKEDIKTKQLALEALSVQAKQIQSLQEEITKLSAKTTEVNNGELG